MEPHLITLTCKMGSVAMAAVALVTVVRVTFAMATIVLETIIFIIFLTASLPCYCVHHRREFLHKVRERESEGRRSSLSLGLFVV